MMSEFGASFRHLRRSPSHVAAIVLSLSVGMAVSVAAFSLTKMLVFNIKPGVSDRRTLIRINWTSGGGLFTASEFELLETELPEALTSVAAQGDRPLPIVLPSGPATISAAFVSARFFETLGTQPIQGRLLDSRDADAGAPVVVISEELWRGAFDGDRRALGRALVIGGRAFTIVGVTPAAAPGLRVVELSSGESAYPQVWLSLRDAVHWKGIPRTRPWLATAGRLSPRSSLKSLRAQVALITHRLAGAEPVVRGRSAVRDRASLQVFRSGLDWRDEPGQSLLVIALFLFVPLGVLGIGCVNVLNLQLARAMDQAGELSLRLALGASRARIMRLLTTEVALLAAMAGSLGWFGARLLLMYARSFSPAPLVIDSGVVGFALCLITLVIGAAGLLPAWLTSRDVVAAGLRALPGGTPLHRRLRGMLVVIQVAASLTLLALSGLAIRSVLVTSPALPPDPREILVTDLDLADVRATAPRPGLFMEAVLDRLHDEPAIEAAAFATFRTTVGGPVQYRRGGDGPLGQRTALGGFVTSGWFDATEATFLAGYGPERSSVTPLPVVINAALASTLSDAGASVLGTELRVPDRVRRDFQSATVVGVVANTQVSASGQPVPMLFLPMPPDAPPALTLVSRVRDAVAGRHAIEAAIHAADPLVPVGQVESIDVRIGELTRGFRDAAWFLLALGVLALGLAAAGLHSLLSYAARRRTREIGIRVAVGADTRDVVWLVLKPGLWLVLIGAGAGLATAVTLATVLRSALFGISPLDLRALLPSVGVLFLVSLAASALPAYRAARVNPVEALRHE